MTSPAPTPEMTVEQVMRLWPATIAVFLRHRMRCVGCAVGPFHSVAEAGAEYRLAAPELVAELAAAARGDERPTGS
jgi:hybrid cluster-associated redox disulfide protein